MGTKGNKAGVEEDAYRLPTEDMLPYERHDWYCFHCHGVYKGISENFFMSVLFQPEERLSYAGTVTGCTTRAASSRTSATTPGSSATSADPSRYYDT